MSEKLKFYGPRVSTYCRICEVVAEEKGAPWENIPTDSKDPEHRKRHPFGRAPALEYGDVKIYEALAIATWIDGTFGEPDALQPSDPLARATMLRWVNIVDHYLFPVIEHEFVMPWVVARLVGAQPDRERAQKALGPISLLLDIPNGELAEGGPQGNKWLAGDEFSFADIWLAATLEGLAADETARKLIADRPALAAWLAQMRARKSWQATTPDLSTFPGFKHFVGEG